MLTVYLFSEPEVWSDYSSDAPITDVDDGSESCPTSPSTLAGRNVSVSGNVVKPLVTWLVAFSLLLQARFHIRSFVLEIIMKFLKVFFLTVGKVYGAFSAIGNSLPGSLYLAREHCGIDSNTFKIYCVCKRCHHVWILSDCIESNQIAKLCSFIPLSAARHQNRCGGVLLKTVELASGKKMFYPLHTFCYVDVRTPLQLLLYQEEFVASLDHWRSSGRRDNECVK